MGLKLQYEAEQVPWQSADEEVDEGDDKNSIGLVELVYELDASD